MKCLKTMNLSIPLLFAIDIFGPGVVVHACNPSTLGSEAGGML